MQQPRTLIVDIAAGMRRRALRRRVLFPAAGALVLGVAGVATLGTHSARSKAPSHDSVPSSPATVGWLGHKAKPSTKPAGRSPVTSKRANAAVVAGSTPSASNRAADTATTSATTTPKTTSTTSTTPHTATTSTTATHATTTSTPTQTTPTTSAPTVSAPSGPTPGQLAQAYIGHVQNAAGTVQSAASGIAEITQQASLGDVSQFVQLAQQARARVDSVSQDFAASTTSGSVGQAEAEVSTAVNDLVSASAALVAYTEHPTSAALSHFTSQYGKARNEWNGGVRTLWQIAGEGNPPTI